MHAHRDGRDGDQDERDFREGGRRPGGDARVHPREPPPRLSGLRQGRRVPAAGPHVPPWARQHADVVREAHRRQADPRLAPHRARPRALHPLLPLHALLGGRLRGRPADRSQPRCAHRDRDLRGRAVPLALLRQRRGALPGRRAHLDALPLRRAAVGHPERPDRVHRMRGRVQHVGDHPRGQGQEDPLTQPSRDRSRVALRQGPLLVSAPPRRGSGHDAAPTREEGPRGGHLGRGARRGRDHAPRVGRLHRDRVLRLRDDGDRVRPGAAAPIRPRRALGRSP